MTIRPAEPKDAYAIAVVHVKTWQHAYKGQLPDDYLASLSIEQRTEMWNKILAKQEKNSHCLVAETEGVIVAWCSVGPNRDKDMADNTGELWGIYVLPEY
ncbi:MAG: GNAT family N-acetyltransferase, partial [Blastocatellia bacterium]